MSFLDEQILKIQTQINVEKEKIKSFDARLAEEKKRVSTAKRFSPGLLDQSARSGKTQSENILSGLQKTLKDLESKLISQRAEERTDARDVTATVETTSNEGTLSKIVKNPLTWAVGGLGIVAYFATSKRSKK